MFVPQIIPDVILLLKLSSLLCFHWLNLLDQQFSISILALQISVRFHRLLELSALMLFYKWLSSTYCVLQKYSTIKLYSVVQLLITIIIVAYALFVWVNVSRAQRQLNSAELAEVFNTEPSDSNRRSVRRFNISPRAICHSDPYCESSALPIESSLHLFIFIYYYAYYAI